MYETTIRQFEKLGYACLPTLVSSEEIDAMCLEMKAMVSGAPLGPQSSNDRDGNPVPFPTDFSYHDHNNAPLLIRISNQLRRSALMRIVYANPSLLLLVEALFGPKFVPFAESIIVKLPGTGAPIPFHQDGKQHYDIRHRGLNLGIYLQPSTTKNGCLWAIPRSHLRGLVDVSALRGEHGPLLPDSLPVEIDRGGVTVHDRSLIHGSLTNTSSDLRITVYFGFHKLSSVESIHDRETIRRRAQIVSLCIAERQKSKFRDETPYDYALRDFAPPPASESERNEVLGQGAIAI